MSYANGPAPKPLQVTLDLQELRTSMALWRDTLVLCQPQAERSSEVRVIQVKMLRDLHRTLTGWLDLLKMCKARGPDAVDLQDIRIEVADCKAWAAESLAAINLNDSLDNLHLGDQQP